MRAISIRMSLTITVCLLASQRQGSNAQLIQEGSSVVEPLTATEQAKYEALEGRQIHRMTNVETAEYLRLRTTAARTGLNSRTARQEVGVLARRSVGLPFRLNGVQFDLSEGDCVSFVNRMLALSVASGWDEYVLVTERLRHKNGIVDYRNRNFFTLGDWLPNNAWLLEDVTTQMGSAVDRPHLSFTHVVRPKVFEERPAAPGSRYTRVIFKGSDYKSGIQEVRQDSFIPVERLPEAMPDLQTGDVALILRKASGGHLGCDHLGLVVVESGRADILHCAPPSTLQEPIPAFLSRCNWVVGVKFLRLRQNARSAAAEQSNRIRPDVPVMAPVEQDQKIAALRARRAAASNK